MSMENVNINILHAVVKNVYFATVWVKVLYIELLMFLKQY
jgi:hypothetical protein